MKIICSLFLLLSLSTQFVLAQSTQAELDKMMKQAQEQLKKYGQDTSMSKMMKGLQDQQKQVAGAMNNRTVNNGGATNGLLYNDAGDYSNVDNWKFPAKNMALLSSIPKNIFTRAELVIFLNDTYSQLSKKLPVGINRSVETVAMKYKNNGNKMGDAAVTGWYTNYREESLLLIIKAAATNPDNGVLLNNCAALLNMGGIEQKAIPILKYILQSYPGSGMVLNNLGQAYAGLGETDTAMVYLGRCIKIEPENPEANNTAGQIEATKGNKEKAAAYFEQSLKGAYSKPAQLKLRRIKPDSKIVPLIKPRVKVPDYFNQFKYKLPLQLTQVENAAEADASFQAFREIITTQLHVFGGQMAAAQQKLMANQNSRKPAGYILHGDEFVAQPYYELCGIMYRDLFADFTKDLVELGSVTDKKYFAKTQSLENEYEDAKKKIEQGWAEKQKQNCCGEGNTSCCISAEEKCKTLNALADSYLPQFAALTEDWQQKNKNIFNKYFDDLAYWGFLTYKPISVDGYRVNIFYPLVIQYLTMLGKIGTTKIIEPCHFTPVTARSDSNSIREMNCPLQIEIPFLIGKFEIDCEKFSFSGGEGAIFSYENNFKTHQSTVSVGIGLKLEAEVKLGPLSGGVSAGVGESLFISFDGNNKFSDAGLKVDAKASAGIGAATGEHVIAKKDILQQETGVGFTVGINSGWNFDEGPFKGVFGPQAATQINKNVQSYKPDQR
jgi:tetratricopeptide (TPR) repeat protein